MGPGVAFAIATSSVAADGCPVDFDLDSRAEVRAAQLGGEGKQRLFAGEVSAANACFELAARAAPRSAEAAVDLALGALAAGDVVAAAAALDSAEDLGAAGAGYFEARALLASRTGDDASAQRWGREAGTWEGRLLSAASGDGRSAIELGADLSGRSRAPWTHAALALNAAAWGRQDDLATSLRRAAEGGENAPALRVAARRALERLRRDRWGPIERAGVRAGVGAASNPGWVSSPGAATPGGFVDLQGGLLWMGRLGAVALRARIDGQQRLFFTDRDRLAAYDLTGLSGSVGARVPLGRDPSAAELRLQARFTGAWTDDLAQAVGSLLEVGPALGFRVAPQTTLHLAFFGVRYDFDSTLAPVDGAQADRDRVGQRAALGVTWRDGVADVRFDAMFTADQAATPAFDAVGGGLGAVAGVWATPRLRAELAAAAWIREFGPAVVQGPTGSARSRAEVRSRFGLELAYRVAPGWSLRLRNDFIATFARSGADYENNVLGLGVEVKW